MARLPQRQSGLPAVVNSLVGRGPQIAAVLGGLRAARVVTLTGPGGCGKTRLALRAATLAADGFGDGARLVELASFTDPALVPASVAEALGVDFRNAVVPSSVPEVAPFPAGLNDCVSGLKWVIANSAHLTIDPDRVIVAGESGGGNLTLATGLELKQDGGWCC